MYKYILILSVFFLGCNWTPAKTANTVAITMNSVKPVLIAEWEQLSDHCVDISPTELENDKCTAKVDESWIPIFDAYNLLASAHALYKKSLESGATPSLLQLQTPYCNLRKLLSSIYSIPDFPGAPCQIPVQ